MTVSPTVLTLIRLTDIELTGHRASILHAQKSSILAILKAWIQLHK
jgi:hypothetical protein